MIAENIRQIRQQLPEGVRLLAVSKTKPVQALQEAYAAGQRLFGENYATELRDKQPQMPPDVEWHFIGHVQSKQLKYYIGFVAMIHGVDSVEHLEDVERAAAKVDRVVDVLLQVHVAREESKFGFSPDELLSLDAHRLAACQHVRIRGLMAMASHTDDRERVREDFMRAQAVFDELRTRSLAALPAFDVLSMGMSHDYGLAVECGSTMVRVGSGIFGPRDYGITKH